MKISLVLITKNSQRYAKRFFEALKIQTRLPDEIILVDASTTKDITIEIAKRYFPKIKVFQILGQKKETIGLQRFTGAEKATGDILAFTDIDACPYNDWLTQIEVCFKSWELKRKSETQGNLCRAITGTVIFDEIPDKIPQLIGTRVNHCNTAYSKELLKEIPFDKTLARGDDADMGYRISKKYSIFGCPKAKVYHYGTFHKSDWIRSLHYAEQDLVLLKKHKSFYMFYRPIGNVVWNLLHFKFKFAFYKLAALCYVLVRK